MSTEVGRLAAEEGRGMELGTLEEQAQGEDRPAGEQRDDLLFLCRAWSVERDVEQHNHSFHESQNTFIWPHLSQCRLPPPPPPPPL